MKSKGCNYLQVIVLVGVVCLLLPQVSLGASSTVNYSCSGISEPSLVYLEYDIYSGVNMEIVLDTNRGSQYFFSTAVCCSSANKLRVGLLAYTDVTGSGTVYIRNSGTAVYPTLTFQSCKVVNLGSGEETDMEPVLYIIGIIFGLIFLFFIFKIFGG